MKCLLCKRYFVIKSLDDTERVKGIEWTSNTCVEYSSSSSNNEVIIFFPHHNGYGKKEAKTDKKKTIEMKQE